MREIESARGRSIYEVTSVNKSQACRPRELSRRVREAEANLCIEDGRTDITLRRHITYLTYSLLALNTVCTLTIVFFVGFGLMALSNTVIVTLIGQTIAHVSMVFITMTKYLYPTR